MKKDPSAIFDANLYAKLLQAFHKLVDILFMWKSVFFSIPFNTINSLSNLITLYRWNNDIFFLIHKIYRGIRSDFSILIWCAKFGVFPLICHCVYKLKNYCWTMFCQWIQRCFVANCRSLCSLFWTLINEHWAAFWNATKLIIGNKMCIFIVYKPPFVHDITRTNMYGELFERFVQNKIEAIKLVFPLECEQMFLYFNKTLCVVNDIKIANALRISNAIQITCWNVSLKSLNSL